MKNFKHKLLLFLERQLAYIVINLLFITLRYNVVGLKKPYPKAIYAFWHKDILPLMIKRKHEKTVILISPSKDGDYIAEPAKKFGYTVVRGSSSSKGTSALKEMVKLSKFHSLAITPDGPRGPANILKDGVLQLSFLSKLPIIATRTTVSRAFVFNSWDKFYFPLPFAKVTIEYSEPFIVNSKDDFESIRNEIQNYMNNRGNTKEVE